MVFDPTHARLFKPAVDDVLMAALDATRAQVLFARIKIVFAAKFYYFLSIF